MLAENKIEYLTKTYGQGNVQSGKFLSGKCPVGEVSVRGIARSENCPFGEVCYLLTDIFYESPISSWCCC